MSRSRVDFDEREFREPMRRTVVRDYDDVEIRRERERVNDRIPAFMREENRRVEPGQMVLRQREIETVERPRQRSPSPAGTRITQRVVHRTRSVSPPPRRLEEDIHFRRVAREPSRGPGERIRFVPSRSSSPDTEVRERIRITEREKERAPSPAPRPPTPKVIKGPTVEREVITHYRDIDHGVVAVRPPSPPPPPVRHRDTEIDIYTSRGQTDIDIHKHSHTHSRGRSISRERPSRRAAQTWEDDVTVHADRKHLHVDIERRRSVSRTRRAQSAAPPTIDYGDEEYEITNKLDSRGKMGEAWNGITKDWAIIDVPPGTERVRMDGAGGASAEVTWQKYSGVRRAKFIPEREDKGSAVSSTTSFTELRAPERERRLSVHVVDKDRGVSRERDVEVEKVTDRRITVRGSTPPARRPETWTEITKDLVCREAIQDLKYEFEETEYFYYIVEYLSYEDVLQLVKVSDRIRAARKERAREIAYERDWRENYDHRDNTHHHGHR